MLPVLRTSTWLERDGTLVTGLSLKSMKRGPTKMNSRIAVTMTSYWMLPRS